MKVASVWAADFQGGNMLEKLEEILEKMYQDCDNEEELEEKYDEIRSMSAVCLERRAEEIRLDPDQVGY